GPPEGEKAVPVQQAVVVRPPAARWAAGISHAPRVGHWCRVSRWCTGNDGRGGHNHTGQRNDTTESRAAPRSRCLLRTPNPPLESEDAPFHLRRAKRDPHHRPPEDAAPARARAEARPRCNHARRERFV